MLSFFNNRQEVAASSQTKIYYTNWQGADKYNYKKQSSERGLFFSYHRGVTTTPPMEVVGHAHLFLEKHKKTLDIFKQ